MSQRRASLFWPALFTGIACALLVALGQWQLQRLAWKERLIVQIEARAKSAPEPLPGFAEWPSLRPDAYEYCRVEFDGTFEHDKEALVFRGSGGGTTGVKEPGYFVLTPLRLASGAYVIVNRGFVPQGLEDRGTRIEGEILNETHVTGLMRGPETRNFFTPRDEPARGRYFTRDPASIAAHFGLETAAPFSVDAEDRRIPGGWPKGGTTELSFPNNHLSYAVTWFGLAFACLGVFAAFAWSKR